MKVHAAMKALIKSQGKFLVLKQIVNDKEAYDLPGGKIEFNENPIEVLHREVKEEINTEVEIIKPLGTWWFFRLDNGEQVICNTYLCSPRNTDIDLANNPSNERIESWEWVSKEELIERMDYPGFKEVVSSM